DFLTKPVNDIALITRVKSLVRLKMLTDELTMRIATGNDLAFDDRQVLAHRINGDDGKILLVDDRASSYERITKVLGGKYQVDVETDPQESVFRAAEGEYDLFMVNMGISEFDALRLCSQVRSLDRTRLLPVLVIVDPEENARLLRALDLGVNDYLVRPIDPNEMLARIRTQIRKKRFASYLRDNVQQTIEMAMTDGLTGLHNRRYLENHLSTLFNQATSRGKPLSLLIIDIDFFKAINDSYGHDAGDDVLREFANRIRANIRGIDLASRYGGEEFVVVLPETDASLAYMVAERIRRHVAGEPFQIYDRTKSIEVTISIGVASLLRAGDTPEQILKRADQALYTAKRDGRNRVVADAA
ncbi:MAG: PleD family two-component system response regulator, partial [Hyphomicrobiales bacterium]|nr:PleD family two-component system response regulator [Hyphomicrobiales bacterium]